MRHHDCGRPLALEDFPHLERQPLAQPDIEIGKRLVEQDQFGARGQGAGEGDALLLAAGELMRELVAQAGQTDRGEQLADPQVTILLPLAAQPEGDIFLDTEVRQAEVDTIDDGMPAVALDDAIQFKLQHGGRL